MTAAFVPFWYFTVTVLLIPVVVHVIGMESPAPHCVPELGTEIVIYAGVKVKLVLDVS